LVFSNLHFAISDFVGITSFGSLTLIFSEAAEDCLVVELKPYQCYKIEPENNHAGFMPPPMPQTVGNLHIAILYAFNETGLEESHSSRRVALQRVLSKKPSQVVLEEALAHVAHANVEKGSEFQTNRVSASCKRGT
jgi:hypothetical protein